MYVCVCEYTFSAFFIKNIAENNIIEITFSVFFLYITESKCEHCLNLKVFTSYNSAATDPSRYFHKVS